MYLRCSTTNEEGDRPVAVEKLNIKTELSMEELLGIEQFIAVGLIDHEVPGKYGMPSIISPLS